METQGINIAQLTATEQGVSLNRLASAKLAA
jgi:predicted HicB family RNase H-like nuclease